MMNRHSEYTALLMRHRDMLWRMCRHRANGDRDRCQDLMQEVSIALWENMDKMHPGASPHQERAWVCWQARSVFYRLGRRRPPTTVPINEAMADSIAADDPGHLQELIDDLIATLSPDEQRMVRLSLEGYHGDEIGEAMGMNRNTVYQRMRRVAHKLRSVVLLLLALLLASMVAVAVVPEWRQKILKVRSEETPPPTTLQGEREVECLEPAMTVDSLPASNKIHSTKQERTAPMDRLNTTYVSTSEVVHTVASPYEQDSVLTIAVNGGRLVITGADGELVRVYDEGGTLVAAQTAGFVCIIDLLPTANAFQWTGRSAYRLQIGDRPAMKVII